MGKKTICTPYVIVNNELISIVPNTLSYTEGFGEYIVRGVSQGAGKTETIFSEDDSKKMSKVNFEIYPTDDNIKKARKWKSLKNDNVIEFADVISKTFSNVSLVNDYSIDLGAETTIKLEWIGDPAV